LFYIGHPAHFHNVVHLSKNLEEKGHSIIWVVREKDVLFRLAEGSPYKSYFIREKAPKSKWGRILRIVKREWVMLKIMLRHKPDVSAGTDLVITHLGKLLNIPSVIINEDDAEAVPLFADMGMKYATAILAPESCSVGPYGYKTTFYKGYQELAYLHPDYFKPDKAKIQLLYGKRDRFYLLRFASLTAHHDDGKRGIDDRLAKKIIRILEENGQVWITSERPLVRDLEPYRIAISPRDMHHAMFFASLYIGDSQTMAAEAAVLGTPSLRYNDFVGKLGYLEDLEHTYGLTYGIPVGWEDELLERISALSGNNTVKSEWGKKRQRMLNETIDVTAFWTHFFEDYSK